MNLEENRFNYKFRGSLKNKVKGSWILKDAIQAGYFYIDKHKIDGIKANEELIKKLRHIINI